MVETLFEASEVDWSGFLPPGRTFGASNRFLGSCSLRNVLFWNLNYWDSASTLAGEVQDAERAYPKALALALIAVVLSYLLPLCLGKITSDCARAHRDEYLIEVDRPWHPWANGGLEELAVRGAGCGGRSIGWPVR